MIKTNFRRSNLVKENITELRNSDLLGKKKTQKACVPRTPATPENIYCQNLRKYDEHVSPQPVRKEKY